LDTDVDACTRGGLGDCPALQWQIGMHPEKEKALREARMTFMTGGFVTKFFSTLFQREKVRGGDSLPEQVFAVALRVCKSTLECDEVVTMLDENGYTPAAVTPVKNAMGDALSSACLGGDCVCGEAARLLDANDPRREDLARLGCEDGEPDGCY